MNIRKLFTIIALILSAQPVLAQETIDKIIAIVGDNIILQSELYQYSYSLAVQLGIDPQEQPEKLEKMRQETLNNLITQKVLLEKAKLDSIVVTDEQVDVVLEEQIARMTEQMGSEEKVKEYFGMSLRQIRREFRKDVKERLLVENLQNKKAQEIQISRREVEKFYRTYRDSLPEMQESINISHILLKVEPSEPAVEAAREKIEAIKKRIEKGEDFAELARQYSEDPGSAAKGGDLGTMQRGDLVREFEEVAFLLEPGEVSDVVRTRFGLHIIKLENKVGEKINPRHILIRLDTSEEDAQRTVQKLRMIKNMIRNGEMTFSEAAEKYSQDEQTASNGGDLGWFQIDQFQIKSFKDAVAGLKEGEISDPVKTKFGYHIIKVNARKSARALDIEDDWKQIENWALNMKRQQELQEWVDRLKKDVYIEIKI
ncbi:parvulin peptidyl-prolyl isomerase [candidate division KSB1 bacterium]|nr:parvulin peptidyl-prolyl isomerase [candidate division KSB1 bacterium]NIR72462.1 parvulin peptidyl-prolyl isomerase [candidate division KSB1 bacterium]NIS24047.1 parvulin peptidyl-prolyl isomerase [candidate division KSB1 bacterium]NIT70966.1 parvulin peptidyl-prolyl isomerase [candidate division KSB1 bacterium]NIU27377.1 parvulin peptidyl-prolyl isomerase [candidate division KSB1 bacterium]